MSETLPIEVGQQVELKPGMDAVYQKAGPASQAKVVDFKVDDDGFRMVKVQWDRRHWRYNGEPDGWTHIGHWQPVERHSLLEARDNTDHFAEYMTQKAKEAGLPEEQIDLYIDQLNEVANILAESEGFIILTARNEPSPTEPDDEVLIPYAYGAFLSPQAMALLEAQFVSMAAGIHHEMADRMYEQYRRRMERDDKDD